MAQASKAGKQDTGAPKKGEASQTRKPPASGPKVNGPSAEQRYMMVQEAAYYHAQKAGFGGDAVEHWLAAEKEIDRRLGRR